MMANFWSWEVFAWSFTFFSFFQGFFLLPFLYIIVPSILSSIISIGSLPDFLPCPMLTTLPVILCNCPEALAPWSLQCLNLLPWLQSGEKLCGKSKMYFPLPFNMLGFRLESLDFPKLPGRSELYFYYWLWCPALIAILVASTWSLSQECLGEARCTCARTCSQTILSYCWTKQLLLLWAFQVMYGRHQSSLTWILNWCNWRTVGLFPQ